MEFMLLFLLVCLCLVYVSVESGEEMLTQVMAGFLCCPWKLVFLMFSQDNCHMELCFLPSNLCQHFSIAEIKEAANDFDEGLLLVVGGFGKVYCGNIGSGTKVAIKRANPLSEQVFISSKVGSRCCRSTGIDIWSLLLDIVKRTVKRSSCMIDYMAFGTLREHLYKTQKPTLPWGQRHEICIGAAYYLHTGAKHSIIHRDLKTTNILFDEKCVAKVSDLSLSKTSPSLDHTNARTVVKGSFGYLDSEYFRRKQLQINPMFTHWVVLFEALCARTALNPALPKEQVSLDEWGVHRHHRKGTMDQIIDP